MGANNASLTKGEDVEMKHSPALSGAATEAASHAALPTYTIYQSPRDISYAPEEALTEGLAMVKTLKANIKRLELGSKLRKDVWLREIERCVYAPQTRLSRI